MTRQVCTLNPNWQFRLDDESETWETVHLPHSVRLEPVNASGGRNFQGVCWYERTLDTDPAWSDRKLFLHFDGAMQVAEIFLNDQPIARHFGGYTPFRIDITDFVKREGENRLKARLDNRDDPQVPPGKPQNALDFTYFGGLYRSVRLEVTDRLYITDPILADKVAGGGIFVTYPKVTSSEAHVRICTEVRNDHADARTCTLRQELIAPDGQSVVATAVDGAVIPAGEDSTITQTLHVHQPRLWHPHHPHRYTLRTTVFDGIREADVQTTRIGIRHLRFDAHEGFFINHEKFRSIGVNRHQDHPLVGYAMTDSQHWQDVKKLREGGFTSCRCHYPQAPAFMDACDELGMLTIVSNPGWQFVGDETFRRRAVENARVMVRRDRNRPSVILWEAALNETDNSAVVVDLHRAVHEEFPGDQCFTAGDQEKGFESGPGHRWDVHYLGNDGKSPYWVREWGDVVDNWADQQSSNRVSRAWGEGPMLQQALSYMHRLDQLRVEHHGTSCGNDGERLCGACLWAGIDYNRGYHHQPFFGGVLDSFRLEKFAYYFFQSQRDPHIRVPGLDDGPMVFVANFFTPLSATTVTVFSNCESVRLLHNGKEIGLREPDSGHRGVAHPPFTFHLGRFALEQSTMCMTGTMPSDAQVCEFTAEGMIRGQVVARHTRRPPGVAAKLRLHLDRNDMDLIADGVDFLRVHAEVCDARGSVCPLADDLVTFAVEGEGSIVGGREIGANPVRAEAGIASALVRSSDRPGQIIVTARAFGLTESRVEITTVPPQNRLEEMERSRPQVRAKEAPAAARHASERLMPAEPA